MVIAILVVIGLIFIAFLPSERTIERSIVVATEASKPFKLVNHLPSWTKWSPWYAAHTTTVMTYSDNPEGEGAWYTWDSKDPNIGKGKLTIANSSKPDSITVTLEFEAWEPGVASYYFETIGEKETKVSQKMNVKAANFFGKLQILIMEGVMNHMFDEGLAKIKAEAEAMADEPASAGKMENLGVSDYAEVNYMSVTDTVSFDEIDAFFTKAFTDIMVQAGIQNLGGAGPAFARYHVWNPEEQTAVIEACIPLNGTGTASDQVKPGKIEAGKGVMLDFFGPSYMTEGAHETIDAYIKENNLTLIGAPIEVYIVSDAEAATPDQAHTKLIYPIQ